MQFKINKNTLIKSLSHIQGVVERRNTIPILSNVKITTAENSVELTATDMDLALTETLEAEIIKQGSITVPAHTFHDIIKKLPDSSEISITYDEDQDKKLQIIADKCDFSLPVIPANDFPAIESGEVTHSFQINKKDLLKLFDKSKFAISTEETRYYLNGIYLHAAESEKGGAVLRAVATDGHRLARFETVLPTGAGEMPGVIVPRKTVAELRKLLDDDDMVIAVSVSETKVRFATPQITLTSKVIDGTFPDYTRVIPYGNTKELKVDASDFAKAVDRVSTVSSERSRAVKLTLDEDRLVLSVNAPDAGAAEEELGVAYNDERLEIGFNAKYLQDIANQVDRENAVFLFNSAGDPTMMREGNDTSAVYVVMPMRV